MNHAMTISMSQNTQPSNIQPSNTQSSNTQPSKTHADSVQAKRDPAVRDEAKNAETKAGHVRKRRKPKIVVSEQEFERLVGLATAAIERLPDVAEELLAEMDRASIVADKAVPRHAVRMGATVVYRTGEGDSRRVTLVYPGEANIADGKISIMTPIGTALIGLSPGQSINWTARDGRQHELTVITVEAPGPTA